MPSLPSKKKILSKLANKSLKIEIELFPISHENYNFFLKYFVHGFRCQILASYDNFDFLDQNCPERVFPVENKKKYILLLNSAYFNWSRC